MANSTAYTSDLRGRWRSKAKALFLYTAKYAGLFALARFLTRSKLRILCYHGFSLDDECEFRPKLFILGNTLRQRFQHLRSKKYTVLKLEEALDQLDRGTLPPHTAAITIDDGFYSTYAVAWPLLKEFHFPATLYVSSYYLIKGSPVFRLATQYLFWKTAQWQADLSDLGIPGVRVISFADPKEVARGMWKIIRYAEEELNEGQRKELLQQLSASLCVDLKRALDLRLFGFVSPEEVKEMAVAGVDIQLHSHRHRFPENEASATQEIVQNREVLGPLVDRPLVHFCYPSGIWSRQQWPWLSALGVRSATTCDPGLNTKSTPKFALHRFLDGENISSIEFEAEICGFSQCIRSLRTLLIQAHGSGEELEAIAPDSCVG